MVHILSLIFALLFFSPQANALVVGEVGTIKGGGVTQLLSRYTIFLTTYDLTSASFSTLADVNTAAGHQASGTVTCEYLTVSGASGSTCLGVQLLYGDNDVGITNVGPTTPIYRGGPASSYEYSPGSGSQTYYLGTGSAGFTFPNGKYAAIKTNGTCSVWLACY